MYGRYGVDDLYKFLLSLWLISIIVDLFINSIILLVIQFIIIFVMIYRVLSKNIARRKKENNFYLRIKKKLSAPFSNVIKNIKDKEHVYVKCRKCKKVLRIPLPMERGIKKVKCPNCGARRKKLVLKKVKVEIITDKR